MDNPMLEFVNRRCKNMLTQKEGTIIGVPEKAVSTKCFVEVRYDDGTIDLEPFGYLQILTEIEVNYLYGKMPKPLLRKIIQRRLEDNDTTTHNA